MARYTAFKVTLWNGSSWDSAIEFDDKEVAYLNKIPVQEVETIKAVDSYPVLRNMAKVSGASDSRERWRIDVIIRNYYSDTISKAESILDATYYMRVYYRPEIDSDYLTCVVDPQNEEIYYKGAKKHNYDIPLKFFSPAHIFSSSSSSFSSSSSSSSSAAP